MSTEQNRALVREMFAALDARDLSGVIAHCAPGCRFHGWTPETLDCDGYRSTMSSLLEAFPDSRFSVDDLLADGDRVAVRHTLRGHHRAGYQGIPPTGKPIDVGAIVIVRFADGKAAEMWLNANFLGMLQQLGVAPA
jgi:predicted ester cyclase